MSDNLHNNNQQAIDATIAFTEKLRLEAAKASQALEQLTARQQDLESAGKQNTKSFQEIASKVRIAKEAYEETTKQIDANIKALKESKNSIEQNKSLLQALEAQQVKLSKTKSVDEQETKKLEKQIASLTKTIASQEDALAKSKEQLDFHALAIDAVDSASKKLEKSNKNFGPVLADVTNGFNMMKDGLSYVQIGFKSVDGAIKTTGFGLLVLALQSVVEYLTTTKEGAEKLKWAIDAIGIVVKVVKATVSKVLSTIGKEIIDAVSNPAETIKKVWNAVIDNITNRFKGISIFFDGLFSGDVKKMTDGAVQMGTGITHVTDKVVDLAGKAAQELKGVAKQIAEIDKQTKKVDGGGSNQGQLKTSSKQTKSSKKPNTPKKPKENKLPPPESPARSVEILKAESVTFSETIEARQANYEKELADLKAQQGKKLITQEEYFKQWAALQEKHHTDIIERSKLFMEKKLDETLKLQQKIAEQNQKDLLAKDEKEINKAFLPAEKLQAEIKLIEDKYAYELSLAGTNADKIAQLQQQKQTETTEITKKHEQDRKNFQLETAQQVSDTAFSILKNNLSSQSSARLKQLDTQKTAELSNTSLTATQRKAIEEKYKKKEAEEKVKAFKAEQRASILQAVINGALAITKVTAQAGLLGAFVIPGIIASTAIQVATIAAQKTPQYAKGGIHYRSDGKGALLSGYSSKDDTNAYLRSGEAVVVSEAMRNPWARNLVSAINVAHGGRDFSVANTGRGYAIGGIFTDGGNSNRYYSQPANDVKDLANTLAYQMINNFPPVYVDVKDINTQQNILAKTVDRVTL